MGTRKSKKDKGGLLLRPVVAENLRENMERFFKNKPQITNRNLWLAKKAELGLGTIQRILASGAGTSIDTLEAIARVLGVQPYKLLMPSAKIRAMLSVDDREDGGELDALHRRPDRPDVE